MSVSASDRPPTILVVIEHGAIDELVVMVRPLSGALALAEAMRAQLAAARDG